MSEQSTSDNDRQFYNVKLRVTNERTGISQVHDVLTKARNGDDAEVQAKEDVLSSDDDVFDVLETIALEERPVDADTDR